MSFIPFAKCPLTALKNVLQLLSPNVLFVLGRVPGAAFTEGVFRFRGSQPGGTSRHCFRLWVAPEFGGRGGAVGLPRKHSAYLIPQDFCHLNPFSPGKYFSYFHDS